MPNREFSRSREAENQKFDQTQRDASSWNIYDRQKGILTSEMATREQRENIQQVIKRRGEITSEGAEVRLGFDAKIRGGMEPRDFTTVKEDKHYDAADDDDSSIWTNNQRRAVRLRKRAEALIADGWSKDYIRSDISEYREQLREELPSDDEAGPSRAHDEAGPSSADSSPRYRQEYSQQEIEELDQVERGMHPTHFLTEDENKDYVAAPNNRNERTPAQQYAVYIYIRAEKLIKSGYEYSDIEDRVMRKRIRYFLTKKEKKDYDDAPSQADERTDEQETAVKLYTRVKEAFGVGCEYDAVYEIYDRYRRQYAHEREQDQAGPSQQPPDYGLPPSYHFQQDAGYGLPPSYPYHFQQDAGYGLPPSYPYHFQQDAGFGEGPSERSPERHEEQEISQERLDHIHRLVDQIYYIRINQYRTSFYTPHKKYMKENMLNETEYRKAIAYLDSQYNTERGTHNERSRIIDLIRTYKQK